MQKLAFVTGGNGGIGTAIVERLLKDGYFVAYTYFEHDPDPTGILKRYPCATSYHCNVLDLEEVDSVTETILGKYHVVDILINNAGVMRDQVFIKMDRNQWDHIIDVNLKSIFNFSHAFLPGMLKQK